MALAPAAIIQHHPSRFDLIPPLREELAPLDVQVVVDPDPNDIPSPWRTYRACLESFPDKASHLLVIQDDAAVCRDFAAALPNVLRTAQERSGGDPLIVLYTSAHDRHRALVQAAKVKGRPLIGLPVVSGHVPTIAVVWPRRARDAFLAHVDHSSFTDPRSDDLNVARWVQECCAHVVATVPSLVEHRWEVDRVFPHAAPGFDHPDRRAAWYIGERSALEVFPPPLHEQIDLSDYVVAA